MAVFVSDYVEIISRNIQCCMKVQPQVYNVRFFPYRKWPIPINSKNGWVSVIFGGCTLHHLLLFYLGTENDLR